MVTDFTYIGSKVNQTSDIAQEMWKRIMKQTKAFYALHMIFTILSPFYHFQSFFTCILTETISEISTKVGGELRK